MHTLEKSADFRNLIVIYVFSVLIPASCVIILAIDFLVRIVVTLVLFLIKCILRIYNKIVVCIH